MASITKNVSVGANGFIENVLTGTIYERINQAANVAVYAVQDTDDAQIEVTLGNTVVTPQSHIPKEPGAGLGPRKPDDFVGQDVTSPGDLIKVAITGGAAASVIRVAVDISPF